MKTIVYSIIILFALSSCQKDDDLMLAKKSFAVMDTTYIVKITNKSVKYSTYIHGMPYAFAVGVYLNYKWYGIDSTGVVDKAKSGLKYNESMYFKTNCNIFKLALDYDAAGYSQTEHVTDWISSDIKEFVITDDLVMKKFTEW